MEARRSSSIRIRKDTFGGICYVPRRDDFFALDKPNYELVLRIGPDWTEIPRSARKSVIALAQLGILDLDKPVKQLAYSGPSFIGKFKDIPTVALPLVVNCFCTSHCPLKCKYCHADDLMQAYREKESHEDLDNVVATTNQIDAIVAVITGGDPLTRPERARYLIEKLAGRKSLVLDTSGVGDISQLIDTLRDREVHVRVSLDAISEINDHTRPINKNYVKDGLSAREHAERTIKTCLANNISVTVQTVICSQNENETELMDLRDSLADWGVLHWVLHIAVRAGNARVLEELAEKVQSRKRGILPSLRVYDLVNKVMQRNESSKSPLDIRCTDTDNTPNSVLLVGSKGDLHTEGLAHNGKVELYNAGDGKPDTLKAKWHYVDNFGHSRRYLNWNPWLSKGMNLEDLCYVSEPTTFADRDERSVVENESKYHVVDLAGLTACLKELGGGIGDPNLQRDEYFDSPNGKLTEMDYVVRLRKTHELVEAAFKGPRSYNEETYSRIEIEIPTTNLDEARNYLRDRNFETTWFFEKKRSEISSPMKGVKIVLDEIPLVGYFLEVEGTNHEIQNLREAISEFIGPPELRNYAELYKDHARSIGLSDEQIQGAGFSAKEPSKQ